MNDDNNKKSKNNPARIITGWLYFLAGIFFLFKLFHLEGIFSKEPVRWCFIWALIGIGAGLLNTRKHDQPKLNGNIFNCLENIVYHLIGYYGFVLLFSGLVSFSTALSLSNAPDIGKLVLSWDVISLKFYTTTAVIALTLGFLGLQLHEIAIKIAGLKE